MSSLILLATATPVPGSVMAGTAVGWFFAVWGGIGLAILPWCIL